MNRPPNIFIINLFNLYTRERNSGLDLLYSKRSRVVSIMLKAMEAEEEKIQKERAHESPSRA